MRLSVFLLLLVVLGCSSSSTPNSQLSAPTSRTSQERNAPTSNEDVFTAVDHLDTVDPSEEPLVVVFFATWCELCAHKVKTVHRATHEVQGTKVVFVAVDDDKTKHHIPGFLREHRMPNAPVIDGLAHPELIERFNPSASIPLVLVMGRDGELVDAQVGLQSGDGARLENSLRLALLSDQRAD